MLIIEHRINSRENLKNVPVAHGVEVDVHFNDGDLVVGHDPGEGDLKFSEYLKDFNHSILAINVKQEGIESQIIEILQSSRVESFFLFDVSFPQIMRMSKKYPGVFALRISDFEVIKNTKFFENIVDWLWVDVFMNANELKKQKILRESKFKKCIVSPELHTDITFDQIKYRRKQLQELNLEPEAVCTKKPNEWLL